MTTIAGGGILAFAVYSSRSGSGMHVVGVIVVLAGTSWVARQVFAGARGSSGRRRPRARRPLIDPRFKPDSPHLAGALRHVSVPRTMRPPADRRSTPGDRGDLTAVGDDYRGGAASSEPYVYTLTGRKIHNRSR